MFVTTLRFLKKIIGLLLAVCLAIVLLQIPLGYASSDIDTKDVMVEIDPETFFMRYVSQNYFYEQAVLDKAQATLSQTTGCGAVEKFVREIPVVLSPYTIENEKVSNSYFDKTLEKTWRAPTPVIQGKEEQTLFYFAKGQWKETIKFQACDKVHQINLIVFALEKNDPAIFPLANGKTLASPIDVGRAEKKVFEQLTTELGRDCPNSLDYRTYDTKVVGYLQPDKTINSSPSDLGRYEQWTVRGCEGKYYLSDVAFINNPLGGYDITTRIKGQIRTK